MKSRLWGLVAASAALSSSLAFAGHGWEGKRVISYQRPNDLFYNSYVGPQPSGTAAQMYVSPLPTPANVGHTYTTYQPFMPHEYMYKHHRSYYTHNPGAGWTRAKVRYGTSGTLLQAASFGLYDHGRGHWPHLPFANTEYAPSYPFYR
ncbi:MAG: hypothetical protein ACRCT8_12630 [Lacipirellulaceae bacterium]